MRTIAAKIAEMKDMMEATGVLVPKEKAKILTGAVEYMKHLRKVNVQRAMENEQLRQQLQNATYIIQQYQLMMPVPPSPYSTTPGQVQHPMGGPHPHALPQIAPHPGVPNQFQPHLGHVGHGAPPHMMPQPDPLMHRAQPGSQFVSFPQPHHAQQAQPMQQPFAVAPTGAQQLQQPQLQPQVAGVHPDSHFSQQAVHSVAANTTSSNHGGDAKRMRVSAGPSNSQREKLAPAASSASAAPTNPTASTAGIVRPGTDRPTQGPAVYGSTPRRLEGACRNWPAVSKWQDPDYILSLFDLRRAEEKLSVSCSEHTSTSPHSQQAANSSSVKHENLPIGTDKHTSIVGLFSGRTFHQQYVQLSIRQFFEYYQSSKKQLPTPHFLSTTGQQYYLCQCSLVPPDPATGSSIAASPQQHLHELLADIVVPPDISPEQLGRPLESISVWVNVEKARSGLHYDCNHNLLCVVTGEKRVTLYPPNEHTATLRPAAVFAESSNHSLLSPDVVPGPARFEFSLRAGDALFIPEGWWHAVTSSPHTIGVNFWWAGIRPIAENSTTRPYVMRTAMISAMKDRKEEIVADRLRSIVPRQRSPEETTTELRKLSVSNDGAALAELLLGMSVDEMAEQLPAFIVENSASWENLVRSLSPLDVECLSRQWEQHENATVSEAATATTNARGQDSKVNKLEKHRQFFNTFFQTETSSTASVALQHFETAKETLNSSVYKHICDSVFLGTTSSK